MPEDHQARASTALISHDCLFKRKMNILERRSAKVGGNLILGPDFVIFCAESSRIAECRFPCFAKLTIRFQCRGRFVFQAEQNVSGL